MKKIADWTFGGDTLIQRCWFDVDRETWDAGWEPDFDEFEVDDIDGATATRELREAVDGGRELLEDGRGVYGYYIPDGEQAVVYCDCDDETYEDHYGREIAE